MNSSRLAENWRESTFVAIDLETTGKYPLEAEICEIAAIRFKAGKIAGEYQTLIKPNFKMSDFVISIHGITNEMVDSAPRIESKIREFHEFVGDAVVVAHHAPFDLGFLAVAIEDARLPLPDTPILCTSLLSRVAFPNSQNHKLQTLIKYLGLNQGVAHRALDDTKACLELLVKCLEKLEDEKVKANGEGAKLSIGEARAKQIEDLDWKKYSMADLRANTHINALVTAIKKHASVQLVYSGGSRPGEARNVRPIGIVRNPRGDFLVAYEENQKETQPKRYFLDKVVRVSL